jgi:hypothetical protein
MQNERALWRLQQSVHPALHFAGHPPMCCIPRGISPVLHSNHPPRTARPPPPPPCTTLAPPPAGCLLLLPRRPPPPPLWPSLSLCGRGAGWICGCSSPSLPPDGWISVGGFPGGAVAEQADDLLLERPRGWISPIAFSLATCLLGSAPPRARWVAAIMKGAVVVADSAPERRSSSDPHSPGPPLSPPPRVPVSPSGGHQCCGGGWVGVGDCGCEICGGSSSGNAGPEPTVFLSLSRSTLSLSPSATRPPF